MGTVPGRCATLQDKKPPGMCLARQIPYARVRPSTVRPRTYDHKERMPPHRLHFSVLIVHSDKLSGGWDEGGLVALDFWLPAGWECPLLSLDEDGESDKIRHLKSTRCIVTAHRTWVKNPAKTDTDKRRGVQESSGKSACRPAVGDGTKWHWKSARGCYEI
jgi:hypothetical protein